MDIRNEYSFQDSSRIYLAIQEKITNRNKFQSRRWWED